MQAVAVVISDVRSILGPQSVNHRLRVVLQLLKLRDVLRQQKPERLEAGLERPRLQREVVGVLHDALQRALADRHAEEIGQPQQLALDRVPTFQLAVENDQHRVTGVDVALVSRGPLPPFV